MRDMLEWTTQDDTDSINQGWGLFYSIGSENGPWQLQRIDDPEEGEPIFEDDAQAWEFVYKQFLVGDKLASKLFNFLSQNCMEEFLRIKNHCEKTITKDGLYNPV